MGFSQTYFCSPRTPWYQFVGSGGIDLSKYTGKINTTFKYVGSKKRCLDGAFQVDDVQIWRLENFVK
jgi:hypothetical protein